MPLGVFFYHKPLEPHCSITEIVFPSYPSNIGFNYEFLVNVSNVLTNTKSFKNTEVVFSILSEVSTSSQLVIIKPTPTQGTNCLRGEQTATSLTNDILTVFGSAVFFDSQLNKEPGPQQDHLVPIRRPRWRCYPKSVDQQPQRPSESSDPIYPKGIWENLSTCISSQNERFRTIVLTNRWG